MSLRDVIADVESRRKTLTVFNPDPDGDVAGDLRSYFADRNVAVETEATESGRPAGFAVLYRGETFLTATSTDALRDLMTDLPDGESGLGVDDSAHADLLRYLKEATFTSYDVPGMVTASREIEDRAWRVGDGQLFAGFQYASTLDGQSQVYRDLAERPLDVHVYASPDEDPPELEGVTVHTEDDPEIERTWFVVFDGAGADDRKSALLAEERGDREFYGFWTYDPALVDRIVAHLDRRYGRVSQ
ncbi:DICT sensory domain-containing protein [Halostella litorea]|uniref:DICT sensory domain-containing protein n=1 Tax=Halostella litorea TaxID=2528831 RepID=UPI001092AE70|nr:DICT sensory domain-containing protein [Halostella litorea]